jgi:hypothetical protein
VVGAALLATQLLGGDPPQPPPAPAPTTVTAVVPAGDPTLTSQGRAILPLTTGRPPLSRYAGDPVRARGARVQQVTSDEGF